MSRDPDTDAGIKSALKVALDTEQQQRDEEHNTMLQRLLGHMDRFINGGGDDRPSA